VELVLMGGQALQSEVSELLDLEEPSLLSVSLDELFLMVTTGWRDGERVMEKG
jgi:hypothetical protein